MHHSEFACIEVHSLYRSFGCKRVLSGIELQIFRGAVYGLVGRNGAGKTTLVRVLAGLLKPDSGEVRVCGYDPWRHEPKFYRSLGLILEHDGFSGNLTFMENILFYGRARGLEWNGIKRYLDNYWGEWEPLRTGAKVKHFSRGQRMCAALCRAFLGWPTVCLLDEPTVGLDIEGMERLSRLVQEARRRGSAILISSHHLSAVEELCDQFGLLEGGQLTTFGKKDSEDNGCWHVVVEGGADETVDSIAASVGGRAAKDGHGWRLSVRNPSEQIPALVEALVRAGIRVKQVSPEHDSLRELMKTWFTDTNNGGGTKTR